MSKASELRAVIKRGGMTIAPGAYDGIAAQLIARSGFESVYMTGAGPAWISGPWPLDHDRDRDRRG